MSVPKQILIFITQIFFCVACFAQRKQIDSLKKALPALKDSARIDCLNALSETYKGPPDCFSEERSRAQIDTAEIFIFEALEEAKKIGYIHGIAKAVSMKAELAFEKYDDYPETEKLSREAIALYKKTANKERLNETYWRLGLALHSQSNFEAAISNYDTSFDLSKKAGDSMYVFYSVITSARVYMERGDYKKAFEKLLDLHQLLLRDNNTTWKAWELQLIGDLYLSIDDFPTALKYYQQGFQLIKPNYQALASAFAINKQFDSAKYYYSLVVVDTANQRKLRFHLASVGEYYFWQNEYDKALSNLLNSLNYNRQDNDVNQVMRVLVDIAKIHLALQNNDSAYRYANEALAIAKQKGARQMVMNSYEILYSIYDHWQQKDSALFYHMKYVAIKDSITSAQVAAKLVGYNFDQKIELLNKEKEVQQVQLQKQALIKNILIGGIIVLLLMGIIIVSNIILKHRNEAYHRKLAENELQIEKLENEKKQTALQQDAIELEMQALRAQMNPHFIFNSLNSINRFILQNDRAQASEYLTKFSKLVRMILQNSQESLISLESELESLELYLHLEAVRFDHRFSYKISVQKDLDISALKVPPLMIQPYAENAIWHGLMHKETKGQLDIEVSQEKEFLFFRIADDGIGRRKSAALASKSANRHKSMGLRITADRIAMIQQSDSNESAVAINDLIGPDGNAAGTEVVIKIPLLYD
jgi:tetratricopeptide (TPR) repeat protein